MSDPEAKEAPRPAAGEVTRLLAAARAGDATASGRLFELVYADLRQLAARHVRGARDAGPSPTSLVHEAFLRIARREELPYADRTHFFAVASRAMRQIVIDEARSRSAGKRGGGRAAAALDEVAVAAPVAATPVEELLAIHDALAKLEAEAPRLAEVVEWHFFGGLTFGEIAVARGVSERTVLRDWRAARALLHDHLAGGG